MTILALAAAIALVAGGDAKTQPDAGVVLLQISTERAADEPDATFTTRLGAMRTALQGVGSCEQAMAAAKQAKAKVFVRWPVPLTSLPAPLRQQLEGHPLGTPTAPFGSRDAVRVLVACPPSFRSVLPKQTGGASPAS